MVIKRTYSFSEEVRLLSLRGAEELEECPVQAQVGALRLHQVAYEVKDGATVQVAEQCQVLEVDVPNQEKHQAWLSAHVGQPIHVQLQRVTAKPAEEPAWYRGVLANEGVLMVALPLEKLVPASETPIGFRRREPTQP